MYFYIVTRWTRDEGPTVLFFSTSSSSSPSSSLVSFSSSCFCFYFFFTLQLASVNCIQVERQELLTNGSIKVDLKKKAERITCTRYPADTHNTLCSLSVDPSCCLSYFLSLSFFPLLNVTTWAGVQSHLHSHFKFILLHFSPRVHK